MIFPIAALSILVIMAPTGSIASVGLVFAVTVLFALYPPGDGVPISGDGLVQSISCFVLLHCVFDLMPQLGLLQDHAIRRAILAVPNFDYRSAHLGLTTLGFPVLLLASIYLCWRWRVAGNPARLVAGLAVPFGWIALNSRVMSSPADDPSSLFGAGILHGCFWLISAIFCDAMIRIRPMGRDIPIASATRRWACIGASLIAMFAGICLVGPSLSWSPPGKKIVVYNNGGLDWDRPEFGRFGPFSGGMFGLLPLYCRAEGYVFDVLNKNSIEPADLADAQIFVLINSPKHWEGEERRIVLDFVSRGGSLLVLGDHTDVFGLMGGFNSLLDPVGIQFRFDSAYHARGTWRGCQVAAPDAVAWGWDAENPSVAVGASLELSGSARPLLTGRYAFSDAGVRENPIGSYLGNYHYDRGEKLGDVVLAATANLGRGRVVVWGDTSAFQGALSSSYAKVVGPVLSWLSRSASWTERPRVRTAAAVSLLAGVAWMWLIRATTRETAAIVGGLLLGLLGTWASSLPNIAARSSISGDTFLIDRSHFPASGHYDARINPVGPLYSNLLRCGFRVFEQDSWDGAAIARSRGVAFIAPQRSIRSGEVEDLMRAEEGGAIVILAVGQPDSAPSRLLLEAHRLALAPRPLGTVTAASPLAGLREREKEPRFLDAWPITTTEGGDPMALPGVEVIYRRGDDTVALFRRVGRGGLLLFADTRYFSDMNIEDMSGHWPGNLALIHDAFVRYAGAKPDDVSPLFHSPQKPQ